MADSGAGPTDYATAVSAVAGFFVILIGGLVALRQLQEARRVARAQFLSDLSRRWDDELISQARARVDGFKGKSADLAEQMRLLEEHDLPGFIVMKRIPNFFEDLGIMAKKKAIDLTLVRMSLGLTVCEYWETYREFAAVKQAEDPTFYEYFEWLSNEMKNEPGLLAACRRTLGGLRRRRMRLRG